MPHLARACVNYLETSLTAKNACLLLSQSRLFEEPELMQRCWEVIDAQVCDTLDRMHVEHNSNDNDELDDLSNAAATYMQLISATDSEGASAMPNFTIVNQT